MIVTQMISVAFGLSYLTLLLAKSAYDAYHGYHHALEDVNTFAENTILCEENPSLLRGHAEFCKRDRAHRHMSPVALGFGRAYEDFSPCLISCSDLFLKVAGWAFIALIVGIAGVYFLVEARMFRPVIRSIETPKRTIEG